jgi:NAD-reducing hydrogenase large subunit
VAAGGRPQQAALPYHWARLIELLYCAEAIEALLHDLGIGGMELQVRGDMRPRGIGVVEARRGTLFHRCEADANGTVTRANLIVSTTKKTRGKRWA